MNTKIWLILLVTLIISIVGEASDLTCMNKGRGYLPYNTTTNSWIGAGYLFEKGACHKAIDSYRSDIGDSGIVCSWTGSGWNIFNAKYGQIITTNNTNWIQVLSCRSALAHAYKGLVCAPRGTGSGVYDVDNGYFIGGGYYFDLSVCIDAIYSVKGDKVCAPNRGYTSIYNRRFNELISNELYFTVKQCSRLVD